MSAALQQDLETRIGDRSHLPAPRTPLLGREAEWAAARALLRRDDTGLLTLTGAGGSGKTRLALAVAEGLRGDFSDVVFVPLASVADPALVLPGIARAVGVPDASTPPLMERLLDALRPSQTLLLLDNFEHVIEAAPQVAELVAGIPSLKVLVTSRWPLRLRDERVLPVPPLALPEEGDGASATAALRSPAVALFVACVRRMRPSFVPDVADVGAIGEICRRLDGLPLAIELAAARCAFLSPRALLDRLGRRLDLLDAGPRDLPDRQQTLRHSIAWSYDLLNPREQHLFRQLAVFAGDVTPDAIAVVAGTESSTDAGTLDDTASLAEKNLLQRADGPDGEPRLRMLETIRDFALEQLDSSGERDRAQRRHGAYVLTAAETIVDDRGRSWLARMDDLQADIRAALRWALDSDERAIAVRLVWRLVPYWFYTGQLNEGRGWAEQMLAQASEAGDQDARVRMLCVAGILMRSIGDFDLARGWLEEAADLARLRRDAAARGACLAVIGQWAKDAGDDATARRMAEESVSLLRGTDEPWLLGLSLVYLGAILGREGANEAARSRFTEALPYLRGCGIPASLSLALINLAMLAEREGDHAAAESLYAESSRASSGGGDNLNTVGALVSLGRLALRRDAPHEAAARLAESIRIGRRVGSTWLLPNALEVLGATANRLGRAVDATTLYGVAAAIRAASRIPQSVLYPELRHATAIALSAALGDDVYDAMWRLGQSLPVAEATNRALALAEVLSEPPAAPLAEPGGVGDRHTAPSDLTAREVEVLRLLAAGLSNREIASRLVLSARTVGHHVEHIYRKTGAHGRAEATAYALRHGLVAPAP